MRAAKHFEIHEHKKPDGIPSGFFVSETVVISTYGVSAHGDDFGDVFEIFVGT
jgi:hypothetical protein